MTQPLIIPPQNIPLFDGRGFMHPMWRSFFDGLLSRVQGANGALQAQDDLLDAIAGLNATPGFIIQNGAATASKQSLGVSGTKAPPASLTVNNGIITGWA